MTGSTLLAFLPSISLSANLPVRRACHAAGWGGRRPVATALALGAVTRVVSGFPVPSLLLGSAVTDQKRYAIRYDSRTKNDIGNQAN